MCCMIFFPINASSVSVLIFVEANAYFMLVVQAVCFYFSGILSGSECVCTALCMFCVCPVVPNQQVSLGIVYCLAYRVLMSAAVRMVYE